jgi:hypothetical protein
MFCAAVNSGYAANVSVLVVETGIAAENAAYSSVSARWEEEFFDVLFEAGHIVSNSPSFSLADKPTGRFPEGFDYLLREAEEGGGDYFLLAFLDYGGEDQKPDAPVSRYGERPEKADLRLFTVRDGKLLHSEIVDLKSSKPQKDRAADTRSSIKALIPFIR